MKKSTILLTCLLLLSTGTNTYLAAQNAVTVGTQVTSESGITSGKAYVLRHGGNGTAMPYVVDNGTNYDVPNSQNSATEASVYYLIDNGDGTWKIKNYYTGKYWGIPVNGSDLSSVASEASAGAWSLNFSGGVTYPTALDASSATQGINRSDQKIHMTAGKGTGNANKIYIYEVADAGILTPPTRVTTGWYLIKWVDVGGDTNTNYTNDDVSGKYVRNYPTDVTVNENQYPLYLTNEPSTTDEKIASLVFLGQSQVDGNAGVSGYLRSANGHYVTQSGTSSLTASSRNYIIFNSRTSYPNNSVISSALTGSTRKSLVPMGKGATPYIGQTVADKYPMVQFYAVDPILYNFVVWSVLIVNGSENEQVTYTGSDASGLKSVYNGGTFFFTSGVTPSASDFTYDSENKSLMVDEENHRIIVAPSETLLASDVAVIQGNETTGKGNTMQPLLRLKITPTLDSTPTSLALTLTGVDQLSNVAIYRTTCDELKSADATPVKISGDTSPAGSLNIPLTTTVIGADEVVYLWVTADVKSDATEWATIDAAVTGITYTNMLGETGKVLDLTATGNPDGVMRIYKQQTALWTPSHTNTTYYRIPTMINTADGGIVALADLRYDHPNDLGKTSTNGYGAHKIDVVSRRSTDGGLTWESEVTVAAGDGSNTASSGYGDPAIVRDADGTLHCLMAAGHNCYAAGMLNMAYSKSTDNGASWSAVTDIYSDIDKGGLTFQSAFTTGGKGVTFANGRMAFAFLGKVSGTTNIYPIYSDDKGATWHVQPTVAYGNGDESKLEIMNDNSLLLSVRKGSYNGTAIRAHNRTTGDASGEGIGSWGTASNWGSEMNANGCNADILYYNRATENASRPDVIFHTLTKAYSTYRKDLRLYMSFDQGETWKEAFQLQPGYAAYSSMQKLANGDLAIIFEDGSIGNNERTDCYAMNYVVLSSELINAKIDELYEEYAHPTVTFISQGETNSSAPWCSWNPSSGWATDFTSNASSGVTGVKVEASYSAFNRQGGYDQRVLLFKPSATGASDVYTITAPDGYYITGYTIGGYYGTSTETYTLTAEDGSSVAINKNKTAQNPPSYLTVSGLKVKQTRITLSNSNSSNSNSAYITNFTVTLSRDYSFTLSPINGKSYATLYLPFGITLPSTVTAYKIAVNGEWAKPTAMGHDLPASTAALLVSDEAVTNATATVNDDASAYTDGNRLAGVLVATSGSDLNGYVLNIVEGQLGFYKLSDDGTLAANRAYLPASEVGSVKGFVLDWDDADAISDVRGQMEDGRSEIYNLAGLRMSKLQRGVNIVKGKKVLVK